MKLVLLATLLLDTMTITGILMETGGVLYHRPREDRHLVAYLNRHGITPRHHSAVDRALRAARFDVQSGRISRDMFYDAILRVHGLVDPRLLPGGRAALLQDASDIELFPGVADTLLALREAGYRLGVVSDTPHSSAEKIDWLAACGIPAGLWDAFVVSSEFGQLISARAIFDEALAQMGVAWQETAFVGHNPDELTYAAELGLVTIAFRPNEPAAPTNWVITTFYGLQNLFLAE